MGKSLFCKLPGVTVDLGEEHLQAKTMKSKIVERQMIYRKIHSTYHILIAMGQNKPLQWRDPVVVLVLSGPAWHVTAGWPDLPPAVMQGAHRALRWGSYKKCFAN